MSKKVIAAIGAGAAGFFCTACAVTFHEIIHRNGKVTSIVGDIVRKQMEKDKPHPPVTDPRVEWMNKQKFEEFEIINADCNRLRGYLLRADEPSDVYVFGSHGYRSCGKGEFRFITKYYHEKGYNVFLVDHQAAGESDGTYIGFGSHESRDCLQWLDFLKHNFGDDIQIILHGVSMGSATVMMMSGNDKLPENVKFTVADCGYTSAWDEFKYELGTAHIPTFPFLNCINQLNRRVAGYDYKEASPLESVKRAKLPMLFVHGAIDDFVPTHMVYELFDACASDDKDLLVVDGAWHAESYKIEPEIYEEKLNKFIDKYIK